MTKRLNGLPVYKMTIDEKDSFTGVEYISLVDFPAIEVNWVAMSSNSYKLYAASQDQQILTGPAMIPELPIYRFDNELGEYYVSFDTDEIKKINRKFNKEQRTLGINYQHQNDSQVKSAVIVEQWFVTDSKSGRAFDLGFDLPIGTWMVSVHIEDKNFWEKEIKSKNVRGFSIEGFLNLEMKNLKRPQMNKQKFETIKTAQGSDIFIDGSLAVDTYVYNAEPSIILIDGKQSTMQYPIWESIIELEDGNILTISCGKIVEINKKETTEMNKIKFEVQVKTKDGVVLYSPADAIAENVEIYIVSETGEQSQVTDGDYILDDGSTITVKDGKITTIVAAESQEEDAKPEEDKKKEDVKYAITPEDIQAISDALGIADLVSRIEALESSNTAMKTENVAMKTLLSKIPGSEFKTEINDTEIKVKTKMSFEDKVNALRDLSKNKK